MLAFIVIATKKTLTIFEFTFTIKIVVLMTISVTLQFVKFVIHFEF